MVKKYLFLSIIFTILGFLLTASLAQAKSNNKEIELNGILPEEAGVYDIKNHPNEKLRVFVYRAKPSPNPATTLQCGLSDPDSSAIVGAAGWKLSTSTPWIYRMNINSTPSSIGSKNLPQLVSKAYYAWQQASGGKVTFQNGGNTTVNKAQLDGQNIISWGRASSSALAVSYIWYNPSTWSVTEIDTIMNQRFPWAWSDPGSWDKNEMCAYSNVYDAQNILTHELGHTMGLDDEYTSDYSYNTMFGYGSMKETSKDTLTTGDIEGITNLYK